MWPKFIIWQKVNKYPGQCNWPIAFCSIFFMCTSSAPNSTLMSPLHQADWHHCLVFNLHKWNIWQQQQQPAEAEQWTRPTYKQGQAGTTFSTSDVTLTQFKGSRTFPVNSSDIKSVCIIQEHYFRGKEYLAVSFPSIQTCQGIIFPLGSNLPAASWPLYLCNQGKELPDSTCLSEPSVKR